MSADDELRELRSECNRLRAKIWDMRSEQLRVEAERDELRAEVERLRPVYEAAKEWRTPMNFAASRALGEVFTCEIHLANATYRALAAEKEQEK